MGDWHVYVLRTAAGSLYTGIATDVPARIATHAAGRGAKALRGRGPLVLVWRLRIGEVGLALRVERAVKSLAKPEKEAFVRRRPHRARVLAALGLAGSPTRRAGARPRGPRADGPASRHGPRP